ncbi:hypoxanthine-guanine phosphoribosyltransferase [Saccharophagus degradans]|uniref:Phosphoribosyltransferase n=1 Tax=Saccharophagus degradans (strain 2-40 / ATCC 43961 / DSM 17024) TaxID=203122 RepID=Q21JS7_SACD2|nr:hypoxanthine-guanine phosphoribosyltransferase [Saccharophagus degradans]ABD81052.1 phosphoribosyltransferase [Saccharophagus degradans 2-40]
MDVSNFENAIKTATCLYTLEQVEASIAKIGDSLNNEFADYISESGVPAKDMALLTIMNGAMVFAGKLLPKLKFSIEVDYIHATRYGNGTQGGALALLAEPKIELQGKTVLLVDDIFDDGITIDRVKQYCLDRGAESVRTVVLAYKDKTREGLAQLVSPPDFVGFNVPDKYVFGMGMDAEGLLRNAPGIYYF